MKHAHALITFMAAAALTAGVLETSDASATTTNRGPISCRPVTGGESAGTLYFSGSYWVNNSTADRYLDCAIPDDPAGSLAKSSITSVTVKTGLVDTSGTNNAAAACIASYSGTSYYCGTWAYSNTSGVITVSSMTYWGAGYAGYSGFLDIELRGTYVDASDSALWYIGYNS